MFPSIYTSLCQIYIDYIINWNLGCSTIADIQNQDAKLVPHTKGDHLRGIFKIQSNIYDKAFYEIS